MRHSIESCDKMWGGKKKGVGGADLGELIMHSETQKIELVRFRRSLQEDVTLSKNSRAPCMGTDRVVKNQEMGRNVAHKK